MACHVVHRVRFADGDDTAAAPAAAPTRPIKYTFNGSLRRANLPVPLSVSALRTQLRASFPTLGGAANDASIGLRYTDDEGDVLCIDTNEELEAADRWAVDARRVLNVQAHVKQATQAKATPPPPAPARTHLNGSSTTPLQQRTASQPLHSTRQAFQQPPPTQQQQQQPQRHAPLRGAALPPPPRPKVCGAVVRVAVASLLAWCFCGPFWAALCGIATTVANVRRIRRERRRRPGLNSGCNGPCTTAECRARFWARLRERAPRHLARLDTSDLAEFLPFAQLFGLFIACGLGCGVCGKLVRATSLLAIGVKLARVVLAKKYSGDENAGTVAPWAERARAFATARVQKAVDTFRAFVNPTNPDDQMDRRRSLGVFVTLLVFGCLLSFVLRFPTPVFWVLHFMGHRRGFRLSAAARVEQEARARAELEQLQQQAERQRQAKAAQALAMTAQRAAREQRRHEAHKRAAARREQSAAEMTDRIIAAIAHAPEAQRQRLNNEFFDALALHGPARTRGFQRLTHKLKRVGAW